MEKETELVVKDFTSILEELTFNSRPIITTLTKIAEENIPCAQYFVDALEARIEKCPPNQKLYAFYAMDSICKNAGSPYTIFFSRNLFNLYKKTYLIVDNNTRTKLINMFKTWMNPNDSTGGFSPLFEKSALDRIEHFLIKASALHQKNLQTMLPKPTVPLLLREIDKLTSLTTERLKNQPNNDKLSVKLVVLSQLKQELLRESLSQEALKQLQLQLRQIFAQDQQVLQDIQRQQQHNDLQKQQQHQQQQHQQQQQQQKYRDGDSSNSGVFIPLFGDNHAEGSMSSSLFGSSSGILGAPTFTNKEDSKSSSKAKSLYDSLESEGLLYKPPKNSIVALYSKINVDVKGNLTSNQNQKKLPPLPLLQNIVENCKAYFATANIDILNTPNLQLSQRVIVNDSPVVNNNLIHLLYRAKPNKCNLCGKRFGNTADEKKLMGEHLDWHFRINKRLKGSEITSSSSTGNTTATQKNIQARNWYLSDSQWISFKDEEIVSTSKTSDGTSTVTVANLEDASVAPVGSESNGQDDSNASFKIDEGVLRKKYVAVPETSEDMTFQCPICKEKTTGLYDEELGEWLWKNTMDIDGKYFHATCYYEAVRNNSDAPGFQLDLEKLKHLVTK